MLENGMVLDMDRHLNSLEEQEGPVCLICGCECEEFYFDENAMIVGCEVCVTIKDAYQYIEDNGKP